MMQTANKTVVSTSKGFVQYLACLKSMNINVINSLKSGPKARLYFDKTKLHDMI